MAKRESTFLNMVIVLFVVSAVAASSLAFVYKFTKDPIEKAKLEKKKAAIGNVVPAFDNNPVEEMYKTKLDNGDVLECYPAKKGGELVGIAVKSFTTKGYSGRFDIMVGFTSEGKIHNISVLEQKETPGLGDKINKEKSTWSNQFNGKTVELNDDGSAKNIKVKKDGGEVDAITASTISSRAYCDAVNRAYSAFLKKK